MIMSCMCLLCLSRPKVIVYCIAGLITVVLGLGYVTYVVLLNGMCCFGIMSSSFGGSAIYYLQCK
jgi:hypothetical protein